MSSDLEIEESMPYKDLLKLYNRYFSIGNLGCDFKNKMALISLTCHLTAELKKKRPDVTHYTLLTKLAEGKGLPESFIKAIAVLCDDFSYGCKEFITFNLENKEMIKTIQKILDSYLPF